MAPEETGSQPLFKTRQLEDRHTTPQQAFHTKRRKGTSRQTLQGWTVEIGREGGAFWFVRHNGNGSNERTTRWKSLADAVIVVRRKQILAKAEAVCARGDITRR